MVKIFNEKNREVFEVMLAALIILVVMAMPVWGEFQCISIHCVVNFSSSLLYYYLYEIVFCFVSFVIIIMALDRLDDWLLMPHTGSSCTCFVDIAKKTFLHAYPSLLFFFFSIKTSIFF